MDNSFDILGHPSKPIFKKAPLGYWLGCDLSVNTVLILALVLLAYVAGLRIRMHVLQWRERSYRLTMRRKHGIPDDDHRPFNVAYSAVIKPKHDNQRRRMRPVLQNVVNTVPEHLLRHHPVEVSSQATIRSNEDFGAPNMLCYPSHSNLNNIYQPPAVQKAALASYQPQDATQRPASSRRFFRKDFYINEDSDLRKRSFDEHDFDEAEPAKKSRVEGSEFMGADEIAEWESHQVHPEKRGFKRVLGDDEYDDDEAKPSRPKEKRARKVPSEKPRSYVADDMLIDEETDEVPELESHFRGKKRDRAEAGSTFGGDDDDSIFEMEADESAKLKRKRRKRRTVSKRKSHSGTGSIAKKFENENGYRNVDHSMDSPEDSALKTLGGKIHKRHSIASRKDAEGHSDVSLVESQASNNSRRIGDEWDSHGVKFKIGPNGQRLRQVLVRKARHKFSMPNDSEHPDRNANLQVYVESWLTEEEFREAKANHLLAWQDFSEERSDLADPIRTSFSTRGITTPRVSIGKNLLWQSANSTPIPSPVSTTDNSTPPSLRTSRIRIPRDSRSFSIATNIGPYTNPFEEPPVLSGRRITSARTSLPTPPAGLSDSTNGSIRSHTHKHKTFSKWEKQDLEAKAMTRMRESTRKKAAEKEAEREAKVRGEKEATLKRDNENKLLEEKAAEERETERAKMENATNLVPPNMSLMPAESRRVETPSKPSDISFGLSTNISVPSKDITRESRSSFFSSTVPAPSTSTPSFFSGFSASNDLQAENKSLTQPSILPLVPQSPSNFLTVAAPKGNTTGSSNPTSDAKNAPFSFGPPTNDGPKEVGQSNTLLSRIGGPFSNPEPQKPGTVSMQGAPNTPAGPGFIAVNLATAHPSAALNTSSNTGLKFDFNVNKPSLGDSDIKSSTLGATSDANKSSIPISFKFTPATPTNQSSKQSNKDRVPFSFGQSSMPAAFGGEKTDSQAEAAPKQAFGNGTSFNFNTTQMSGQSVFGNAQAPQASSFNPFGAPSATASTTFSGKTLQDTRPNPFNSDLSLP